MRIRITLFSESAQPEFLSYQIRAVASCADVGFKLNLHGAEWIAGYLDVLIDLATDHDPEAPTQPAAALRDWLRALSAGVESSPLALPVEIAVDVPDWDIIRRNTSPAIASP